MLLASVENLTSSVSIELVSSSARVTSVKSQQGVSLSLRQPDPYIGPQGHLGPIEMNNASANLIKRILLLISSIDQNPENYSQTNLCAENQPGTP